MEIEHHYFRTTIQFYQQVIPHVFLLFLFLANHRFLGKRFEPIHSDHFWLQSLWPLAIYFLKRPWFSIAQCHQQQNFFSGCSISDALAMTMCCTCLHHLLRYKSGLRNFTGGGMTIFGFIVKVLADVMAESYQGHLSFPLSEVQSLGFLQFQSSI